MPVKASGQANSKKRLGVIAGMGNLPLAVASEAKEAGYTVIGIALQPPADDSLTSVADDFHKISIGRFGGLLALLKKLSITEAVMAGKVPKSLLYENKKNIIPDLKAVKLLMSLRNRGDDTIMSAVVEALERNGIMIHETTLFTKSLLATEGVLTAKKPGKEDLLDIAFGWNIARHIGQLDIGQTVIVKKRAVMAIEAMEGTDEAIKRGGMLAHRDAVVVKVSKPQQDMRFDVPAVGIDTLRSMQTSAAKVLAVEAGKCILVDKEQFIREANKAGIVVAGIVNGKIRKR
jgi:DUF1009 family protein